MTDYMFESWELGVSCAVLILLFSFKRFPFHNIFRAGPEGPELEG